MKSGYRGRIAPTPTGYMHLGHARTFLEAQRRATEAEGALILRIEDLDRQRCKQVFVDALIEDLAWVGLSWAEGPDVGGPSESYVQSERLKIFEEALRRLIDHGVVYPCFCSRKDIADAVAAPHSEEGERLYPGTCRNSLLELDADPFSVNWRFRVPDGESVRFVDQAYGEISYMAGRDFGDFLVWRKDGMPSYEMAVVVDDIAMGITEVVRGEDLLLSTARQILLYRALDAVAPDFFHCPLVLDENGNRLAKRNKALGLRVLREEGADVEKLLRELKLSSQEKREHR